MRSSICFVIPYFGKWPFWMPLFLESCRWNSDINWLIYTDCSVPKDGPPNVRFIEVSYEEYCGRVSRSLGIRFSPENAYKLCDIKPALGYIHAAELEGFDFWAFGDIDLLYGDLRAYFTEERLARKDLFSTHARRVSGHLCLLRNTEEMRAVFMRAKGWKSIFESSEHLAFDERGFTKLFIRHKNSPAWVRKIAAMLDPWLLRAEFNEAFTTPNGHIRWIDQSRNYPKQWFWQPGSLTNDLDGSREFPYLHFMIWKNAWKTLSLPDLAPAIAAESPKQLVVISEAGFQYSNVD